MAELLQSRHTFSGLVSTVPSNTQLLMGNLWNLRCKYGPLIIISMINLIEMMCLIASANRAVSWGDVMFCIGVCKSVSNNFPKLYPVEDFLQLEKR